MSPTAFVDVTFTDGQSAVWGGKLGTAMLHEAATALGGAGLAAIEALSPAILRQCIDRNENPLQRLDALRTRVQGTPLRALVNLIPEHGNFDALEGSLLSAWLKLLVRHGISEIVLLDPLMRPSRLKQATQTAHEHGLSVVATVPYYGDDKAEQELVTNAASLANYGVARIMLRDEAGLLHLDSLNRLIPQLREALGTTPLDLHTRCQTGLGPQIALEAMRLGIARLDTVLPCVANGPSTPSLPHIVKSARLMALPLPAVGMDAVARANDALAAVADQEGYAEAHPWAFDLAPYIHKLPGEVAGEARDALHACGLQAEMIAFAHECERIREELNSPPMLAPFARPIMLTALAHLKGAPRYARIYPLIRRIAQGIYGTPATSLDTVIRRVGVQTTPRPAPTVPSSEEHILAMVAGISPSRLPASVNDRYVRVTPERALVDGLLQRWDTYQSLSVHGPDLAIHFEHAKPQPIA